jgi:hypothetical protein
MNKNYTEFNETKKRLEAAIEAVEPRFSTDKSFTIWNSLPHNLKAPALYVMYYDQILLWYNKLNTASTPETEIISGLLCKFMLNTVDIITVDKCNPKYMNIVIKNTLLSLIDVSYRRSIFADTQPLPDVYDNNDYDGCNYGHFPSPYDERHCVENSIISKKVSQILDNFDSFSPHAKKVIEYYTGYKKSLSKDTIKHLPEVMREIRDAFAEPGMFINSKPECNTFEDVLLYEDMIEKAIITMKDGREAYYEGEKEIFPNGRTSYILYSGRKRYVIPRAKAKNYSVVKIYEVE